MKKLYLASTSPRRAELLEQMGVPFEKLAVNVDESKQVAESVVTYVQRLARDKAMQGINQLQQREAFFNCAVLGADTIVAQQNGRILGKPQSREQAVEMLRALANCTHSVYTAVAVLCSQNVKNSEPNSGNDNKISCQTCCVETKVSFGDISETQIQAYCLTKEPFDKAGAYAIQGAAAAFVRQIHGSYTAVVGLPLYETRELLLNAGVVNASKVR